VWERPQTGPRVTGAKTPPGEPIRELPARWGKKMDDMDRTGEVPEKTGMVREVVGGCGKGC